MLHSHSSLVFTCSQGSRRAFHFLHGGVKLFLNSQLKIRLPRALYFGKLSVHLLPGFADLLAQFARHFFAQGR